MVCMPRIALDNEKKAVGEKKLNIKGNLNFSRPIKLSNSKHSSFTVNFFSKYSRLDTANVIT
jgi:hypothetical protein